MILIVTIWLIAFFVLFSFGDMLLSSYIWICKSEERYGIMDTVMLGMCFVLIPLQILSLFLPSNHYTLALFTVVSIVYWLCNKEQRQMWLSKLKDISSSLSIFQKTLLLVAVFAVLISVLIPYPFYDADYYHYQNIKWNEHYAVVPGLGNFEDRFGFNSNYFLLSSIFTFSFVSGEAYIVLQGLLFALILAWALTNFFVSKYDVKYLLILIFLLVIYFLCLRMLKYSSTDILPILCLFYFLSKTTLSDNIFANRVLFTIVLLTSLITCKISTSFISLLSVYIVVCLMKNKEYRKIVFIFVVSFAILALWFTRNVIISGYLVFPIHQVDLFSFDWKMSATTLKLQQVHIKEWAYYEFGRFFTVHSARNLINVVLFFCALPLPLAVLIRRKSIGKNLVLLATFSYITMLLCLINAPDLRFFNGIVFGNALITCLVILDNGKRQIQLGRKGIYVACIMVAGFFILAKTTTPLHSITELVIKPLGNEPTTDVEEYQLGNVTILLTKDSIYRTFYTLPCTARDGLPLTSYRGLKMQDVETIEARGNNLQDGFRTKKEYIEIFDRNDKKYLLEYYKNHGFDNL